jgi:hypothetical protein
MQKSHAAGNNWSSKVLASSPYGVLAALLLISVGAAAQGSSDGDRAAARELGKQGLTALDQGDFAKAEDRLSRAIALHDVPTLRLARARARRSNDHLVSAGEDYRAVLRWPKSDGEPRVFADARREARLELESLEPRIPRLTLLLKSGPATIKVEGVEWPEALIGVARPMDPGQYVVQVIGAAGQVVSHRVRLEAGQDETLTLEAPEQASAKTATVPEPLRVTQSDLPASEQPEVSAAASPSPQNAADDGPGTAAYATGGVALALAVGAVVTGLLYLNYRADFDENNSSEVPTARKQDLRSKASTMGWVATALGGAAFVSGGVSAYLFVSSSERDGGGDGGGKDTARARIRSGGIDRTEFGVMGRF